MLLLSGCDNTFSWPWPQRIITPRQSASVSRPTYPPNTRGTAKAVYATSVQQTSVARRTARALTPTLPPPTYPPYETPGPIDLPLGILPSPRYLQTHPCECEFENRWRGRLSNGYYIDVFAGHNRNSPNLGLILVTIVPPSARGTTSTELYYTPLQAGSVHLVSFEGVEITLLSTNNTRFVFDIGTRTWLSSPATTTTETLPSK